MNQWGWLCTRACRFLREKYVAMMMARSKNLMQWRYEYSQKGQNPKLAAWASTASVAVSATNVGITLNLLSELGRARANSDKTGGMKVPNKLSLGIVCLAVGELNLSFCSIMMQEKNIKFLIFMQARPVLAADENQTVLQSEVIIRWPKQNEGSVVSIMNRENIFGEVFVIVAFIDSILFAISVIFLLFSLALLNRNVSRSEDFALNMIIINMAFLCIS